MSVFIAIIPLTKIPLNSRPLVTTADVVCGIHENHHPAYEQPAASTRSVMVRTSVRAVVRVLVVSALLLISILFPAFDSVCAFIGAALCSLISIILPISFYLKLFWRDMTLGERVVS